jgi:type IV pilus assembly protein PilC
MPEYIYVAADRTGQKVNGKLEAANEGELRMTLRSQGLRPISVSRPSLSEVDIFSVVKDFLGMSESVPMERLVMFVRQLQVMLSSGVPLVQSLELLHEQEADSVLKRILGNSKDKIQSGSFLWEAFAMYPKVFEKVFISLIRAGERSGSIDVILKRVGKYMENSFRLKRLIKSSLMYPAMVVVITIVVVTVMLVFVIPKLEEMIVSSGGELPWLTQVIINMSHWMRSNFGLLIVGVGLAAYLVRSYTNTNEGKVVLQRFLFRLPLFGNLIIRSGVAKFCRTMNTLISSGVPMVDALEVAKDSCEHVAFEDAVQEIKREVEGGSSFATAVVRQKVFPKMCSQMISVGESTGSLDKMLERVADFYEEEVETSVAGMMKMIEPLMLVFLGGAVGTMMIAMYLPIFQMAGSQN